MLGRAGAAVLVGLCCLVSGCSGGDPPPSNPTVTTSTSGVATTTAAPSTTIPPTGAPVLPDAARQQSPEGAEAFVRHWFDVSTYAFANLDSAALLALGDCLTCTALAGTLDEIASRGNRLDGGAADVMSVTSAPITAEATATVNASFVAAEAREISPEGSVVAVVDPGGNAGYVFTLRWTSDTWMADSIQLAAP